MRGARQEAVRLLARLSLGTHVRPMFGTGEARAVVTALLDVDGILALLREQGERDLAIVAIVAGMQDSEDEAIARLSEIEDAVREWRKALDRRQQRLAVKTADGVLEIAPRLRSMIGQVRDRRIAA